jgi:hypothetical protein
MNSVKKDVSEEVLTKLKKVNSLINQESKNKNSQLHIYIDTNLLNQLKKEAKEQGISLSLLCRQKLRNSYNLEDIKKSLSDLKSLIIKFPKS